MRFKSFFMIVVSSVIFLLILTGILNYVVDPGQMFMGQRSVANLAKLIADGNNVIIPGYDINERILQKHFIKENERKFDVIVIGSSRTFSFGKESFPADSFHNFSMSGASVEDNITIFNLIEEKQGFPKTVIICADPWLLNRNNGAVRWENLFSEYFSTLQKYNIQKKMEKDINLIKIKELFSLAYTRSSLSDLRKGIFLARYSYQTTEDDNIDNGILRADGVNIYHREIRERSQKAVNEAALKYISGNIYSVEHFNKLDESLKQQFEAMIDRMRDNNVEVILFLPPYHPVVYEFLLKKEKYNMVFSAERYFKDLATKKGLIIWGAYNPASIGLTDKDFFDGMHLKKNSVDKLLMSLSK